MVLNRSDFITKQGELTNTGAVLLLVLAILAGFIIAVLQ